MISTAQALDALFALVSPLPVEQIPLRHAAGRTLAETVTAKRDQPPFAASAMDGYAVLNADATSGTNHFQSSERPQPATGLTPP